MEYKRGSVKVTLSGKVTVWTVQEENFTKPYERYCWYSVYENILALLENVKPEKVEEKGYTVLKIGGVIKSFHTAFKSLKLVSSLKGIMKNVDSQVGNNERLSGEADLNALWESILENHKDDKEVIKTIKFCSYV